MPIPSVDDTLERLVSTALAAPDATGYFPAMYARVTERVQGRVVGAGFDDPDRMVTFVTSFAERYLTAAEDPSTAAASWQACWNSRTSRLLIVQQLLLGINAHVNFDLPQTVAALADSTGDLQAIRPDFDAINDELAATYDLLLADLGLVARWVTAASAWGGRTAFNFSLRLARDQAWASATRLHALDPAARAQEVRELDRVVEVLAYLVTRPAAPIRWLIGLVSRFEQRDPPTVTRTLLGTLARR